MTRSEALALMDREWRELDAIFAGLTDDQLARPVFTGEGADWRVRDLLPHFASWWRLAARGARRATETGAAPDGNTTLRAFLGVSTHFDQLNAETFARFRERPVAELLAEMRSALDELRDAVTTLPPDLLLDADGAQTDGMRRYIWQPALNHFRQHRPHIESALKEGATT